MGNNYPGEVIHDKLCKDFLLYVLHLFGMKVHHTDCVFKLSESRFQVSTHMVNFLKTCRRKRPFRKIGDEIFVRISYDFYPHNPKIHIVNRRMVAQCKILKVFALFDIFVNHGITEYGF